jgi:hypothetical protein
MTMADEQPKSIRDSIEEALAAEAPDETSEQERPARRPAPEREEGPDELSDGLEERPRDAQGRFIKSGEEGAPEEQPEQPKPEKQKQPEAAPEEQPELPAEAAKTESREQRMAKLTARWNATDKEFLAKQPEDVQDFLVNRDRDMMAAFTRKAQSVAHLENEYGPIAKMFEPEMPAMRAAGYTPRLLIEGWANAERALLGGPQQAASTLRNIAEGYKIPREIVAEAFGFDPRTPDQIARASGAPGAPAEVIPPNGAFRDPRVDGILAAAQEEHERAVIEHNQRLHQAVSNAQAQINAFRDAVDDRGNLLHPHFPEVENYMTALAKFHSENTGKIPNLDQLYLDAVNANPATRARLVADAQRAQSDKRRQAEAARGKTEQARRAGSSVVGLGSGRPNNRTQDKALPQGAGIRAHLHAAFNEVVGDQE